MICFQAFRHGVCITCTMRLKPRYAIRVSRTPSQGPKARTEDSCRNSVDYPQKHAEWNRQGNPSSLPRRCRVRRELPSLGFRKLGLCTGLSSTPASMLLVMHRRQTLSVLALTSPIVERCLGCWNSWCDSTCAQLRRNLCRGAQG